MAIGSGVLISAGRLRPDGRGLQPGRVRRHGTRLSGRCRRLHRREHLYLPPGREAPQAIRQRPDERQQHSYEGSGLAIAVGALLDGIPESVVIGVSLLGGVGVSLVTVAAVFLSNVPEGLSSAAGMRKAGRSAAYVFGVWASIALASGIAALIGNIALAGADPTSSPPPTRSRRAPSWRCWWTP